MPKSLKIVFFGSGPVAAASLEGLHNAGFGIEAVITKPAIHTRDSAPVAEYCKSHNINTHFVTNKSQVDTLFDTTSFSSTLGVVVDFGIIISQLVIDYFEKGIVNSHFSLLPQWRGADPITFSILSGQPETGVSLMVINSKLDEGQLIAQEKLAISSEETTPTLTNKLIVLSNKMLTKYLPGYAAGDIKPFNQSSENISYSQKLSKEDGVMDLGKTAAQLEREVRAYQGWPKSSTTLFGHRVIIKKARVVSEPGNDRLVIKCANNSFLEVLELTAPSGRLMTGEAFLRGYKKD